ncbi:MAG: magnesium transporter [Candidatus Omnitrophica bacterium]|nr:magnesium transporter [Candidatus Omnitrophota bacterium]
MQRRGALITPQIQDILKSANTVERIRELFADMHTYDIFILCENLEDDEIAECIKSLGIPVGIELFEQFDDERKKDIFNCFNKEWMADILEEMSPDERADFVVKLPDERVEEILPLVARAERIDIKKLINYKEDSAGSILTTEYAYLPQDVTAKAAIEKIKLQAFDRETIYYIYVIDHDRKLLGIVSLRDILVAPPQQTIREFMNPNVISVNVNDDKEEVARKFSQYDFLAMPVVDDASKLVGIVTVDDVMDVFEEEATEDIYKLGAAGEYLDYMKSHPFMLARQRTVWLLILVVVGCTSALILERNEHALQTAVALSFFIPLLLGAGGNAGTQSSTVVIRGLATEDIKLHDYLLVWRKEVMVGAMVGSIMAVLGALLALVIHSDPRLGLVVGSAMITSVMLAVSLGALLPMLFKKLKLDPALMSGPFITSIVDIVSLLVYFKIAMVILN